MQGANLVISIRAESALEPELMQGRAEGRIDIGVMRIRRQLLVEQLFEEHLIWCRRMRDGWTEGHV